ncbi:DNA replication licensing factor mcm5 [Caulochytrium protostelioides]|uniref:DNA replication licensing factor MCM5 n=1 Tax=Caulochytrium protostelioides TaxID=1555241 RepID=A0A4P9WVS8_9FUNG|nr:DNA replication licensing factor mcm5 [Caulochytrium protostelioides]
MAALGWDTGRVFSVGPTIRTAENPHSRSKTEEKFRDFLREFRLNQEFIYRDQLRQNFLVGRHFVEVNLAHLAAYDDELANQLRDRPGEYLPLFESAAKTLVLTHESIEQLVDTQVMLLSNANPVPLRELDAAMVSKLVRLSGIVISASSATSKATVLHAMCKSCRHTVQLPVGSGFSQVQLPRTCSAPRQPEDGSSDCGLDPYVVSTERSQFVDQQTVKLQEVMGSVPIGELPRHCLMTADRELVNKISPGTSVTVTGICSIFQAGGKKNAGSSLRTPYIRITGMQLDLDKTGQFGRAFSPEEEEAMLKLSRTPDLYDIFSRSIAPGIWGGMDMKKAITCLLFGGSRKVLPDGMKLRGDVNVLLLGDPGTAKSQLLKFVEKVSPIGVYTSGKGSSAAGLTASVVRDPASREFYLEGGAMVLADGGVVCIDEFDKMREEDRVAIHEAMEQQTISIAKAGITTILNSRTSVLAAANPVFGRYNDMKTPAENIEFQSTILSRFDLIFIVRDVHNAQQDSQIAYHVLANHMNTSDVIHRAASGAVNAVTGELDMAQMRSYITFCKTRCAPRLSERAASKLSSHFVSVRAAVARQKQQTGATTSVIPITIRQLEAITRISESLAKMRLSTVATEADVEEAIRLFNKSTMEAVKTSAQSKETQVEVEACRSFICNRYAVGTRVREEAMREEVTRRFSSKAFDQTLAVLIQKETFAYRNRRLMLQRVGK